jgi:amidase/formamidase
MNIGNTHAIGVKQEVQTMSVMAVQFAPVSSQSYEDVNKNVDTIIDYMVRACGGYPGYDLIAFQECTLQGYHPVKWTDVLVTLDGPEIGRIRDKCRELDVWAVVNPLVKNDNGSPTNTAVLINNKGEITLSYDKANPWIPGEPTHPGDTTVPVVDGPKGSRIALIICADGDYPESWREAAFNGANVIIRPSHYMAPCEDAWDITNKAGAYFNNCYVVATNSVGVDECFHYFGKTSILDYDGRIITQAPTGIPWMTKADIFPQLVDQIRRQGTTSNFMYSFKRRGGSCPDFNGDGDIVNEYSAYANWSKEPTLP